MPADSAVSKRHVFYIPGFDPRGARHYHALYRENAVLQSNVNGWPLDVGNRRNAGGHVHRWTVRGDGVETTYDYLAWDDIVRANWRGGVKARLRDVLNAYAPRVMADLVPPIARRSPRRLLAGFYPLAYLLALCASCVAVFTVIAGMGQWSAASVAGAAAAAVLLWLGGAVLGQRLAVFWLLKIYSFCARWGGGKIPAMDARAALFAAHITRALEENDAQEIMVVGHSVGAILSVPVCAKVLERSDRPFVLVTLGQSIPLASLQGAAKNIRESLDRVAMAKNVFWIDYSAPGDGACFPLMKITEEGGPLALSPRFFRLYEPGKYRRMRYRWYRMHFLYLMAGDYAGAYDYFLMTAGPRSLRARLAEQGAA